MSGIASAKSASARILRNVDAGVLRLVYSAEIASEYRRKLDEDAKLQRLFERHGVALDEVRSVIARLLAIGDEIAPVGDPPEFIDPKDAPYLHCVERAGADYLVTFDSALLDLSWCGGVRIIEPRALLRQLLGEGYDLCD